MRSLGTKGIEVFRFAFKPLPCKTFEGNLNRTPSVLLACNYYLLHLYLTFFSKELEVAHMVLSISSFNPHNKPVRGVKLRSNYSPRVTQSAAWPKWDSQAPVQHTFFLFKKIYWFFQKIFKQTIQTNIKLHYIYTKLSNFVK